MTKYGLELVEKMLESEPKRPIGELLSGHQLNSEAVRKAFSIKGENATGVYALGGGDGCGSGSKTSFRNFMHEELH